MLYYSPFNPLIIIVLVGFPVCSIVLQFTYRSDSFSYPPILTFYLSLLQPVPTSQPKPASHVHFDQRKINIFS